jgi:hypothetical protein
MVVYYATDLPNVRPSQTVPDGQQVTQFAIGPTTNRAYFDDLRGEVDPDLGPCKLLAPIEEGN